MAANSGNAARARHVRGRLRTLRRFRKLLRPCQTRTVGAAHLLGTGLKSQPWLAIPSTRCNVPDDREVFHYLKDGPLQSRRAHCQRVQGAVDTQVRMPRDDDRHPSSLTDFLDDRSMAGRTRGLPSCTRPDSACTAPNTLSELITAPHTAAYPSN